MALVGCWGLIGEAGMGLDLLVVVVVMVSCVLILCDYYCSSFSF
jgi:hypothetical protein